MMLIQLEINRINVNEPDQELFIENDPNIPDRIYSIKSNQLTVLYHNYDRNPALIKVPKYEPIQTIKETHRIALTQERTTIADRLADLKNKSRLQHIEEKLGEQLWKRIASYNAIFNLERDPLPCTELVEHEIILKRVVYFFPFKKSIFFHIFLI